MWGTVGAVLALFLLFRISLQLVDVNDRLRALIDTLERVPKAIQAEHAGADNDPVVDAIVELGEDLRRVEEAIGHHIPRGHSDRLLP